MKLQLLSISILFLLLFSCKKDDTPSSAPTKEYFLFAKVDGASVQFEGDFFCLYTLLPFGGVSITATNAQATEMFTITISENLAVGNFSFETTTTGAVLGQYVKDNQNFTTMETNTGTLTITAFDADKKVLSGKFNFVAKDLNSSQTVVVTEGEFVCRGVN
ncbi:MAG: hypothetical protein LAT76_10510 [Schleiferiaceae bacterium]|nr:hypothetical protein [Schleiferiaceae bacterium]